MYPVIVFRIKSVRRNKIRIRTAELTGFFIHKVCKIRHIQPAFFLLSYSNLIRILRTAASMRFAYMFRYGYGHVIIRAQHHNIQQVFQPVLFSCRCIKLHIRLGSRIRGKCYDIIRVSVFKCNNKRHYFGRACHRICFFRIMLI